METVTFAEVPARAGAIAAVLADEYGVGKGDRVAFASANSLDYALAQLAVVSLGAIIVGLNGWWTGRRARVRHGAHHADGAVR